MELLGQDLDEEDIQSRTRLYLVDLRNITKNEDTFTDNQIFRKYIKKALADNGKLIAKVNELMEPIEDSAGKDHIISAINHEINSLTHCIHNSADAPVVSQPQDENAH